MAKLQRLPNGKLLTVGSKLAVECCCGPPQPSCCDDPGGPPAPYFNYIQLDTETACCTVNLVDYSTAGTCGTIASRSWKKNGVEFSTAENPTGVEVCDDDVIELTVTSTAGCSASIAKTIECENDCGGCNDGVPDEVVVTIPDLPVDAGEDCDACLVLGGTYVLPRIVAVGCVYRLGGITSQVPPDIGECADLPIGGAGPNYREITLRLNIFVDLGGPIVMGHSVQVRYGNVSSVRFIEWAVAQAPSGQCRGEWVFDFYGIDSPNGHCNATGTTAAVVIP